MAEILKTVQREFVPLKRMNGQVIDILEEIPFGGDQLTEERTANTQKAFLAGATVMKRLQGLSPKFEYWHLKKTLYQVTLLENFPNSFISFEDIYYGLDL